MLLKHWTKKWIAVTGKSRIKVQLFRLRWRSLPWWVLLQFAFLLIRYLHFYLTNYIDETGTCALASDTALAYDTFCKRAYGDECRTNYANDQDHMRYRNAELKRLWTLIRFKLLLRRRSRRQYRSWILYNKSHPVQRSLRRVSENLRIASDTSSSMRSEDDESRIWVKVKGKHRICFSSRSDTSSSIP